VFSSLKFSLVVSPQSRCRRHSPLYAVFATLSAAAGLAPPPEVGVGFAWLFSRRFSAFFLNTFLSQVFGLVIRRHLRLQRQPFYFATPSPAPPDDGYLDARPLTPRRHADIRRLISRHEYRHHSTPSPSIRADAREGYAVIRHAIETRVFARLFFSFSHAFMPIFFTVTSAYEAVTPLQPFRLQHLFHHATPGSDAVSPAMSRRSSAPICLRPATPSHEVARP